MNIFLTGASGAIGSETVRRLARVPGNAIYGTYLSGETRARALEKEHPNFRAVKCDLSAADDVDRVIDELAAVPFDAVVNNAFSKVRFEDLHRISWKEIDDHLSVGVRSAFRFTAAFSKAMRKNRRGSIVTILSSVVHGRPQAKMGSYAIAKHALLGLHRAFAAEYGPLGIRVNAVSPSMLRTDFISELPDHYVALIEEASPAKRLATPSEVAAVVEFLLSDGASYVGGIDIPVTGG